MYSKTVTAVWRWGERRVVVKNGSETSQETAGRGLWRWEKETESSILMGVDSQDLLAD